MLKDSNEDDKRAVYSIINARKMKPFCSHHHHHYSLGESDRNEIYDNAKILKLQKKGKRIFVASSLISCAASLKIPSESRV